MNASPNVSIAQLSAMTGSPKSRTRRFLDRITKNDRIAREHMLADAALLREWMNRAA